MTTQDPELSAALGWPGGISDPVLDRKVLLQMAAALRVAAPSSKHHGRNIMAEALRLADLLEQDPRSKAHHDEAAAELRRLHAENASLIASNEAFGRRQKWWNKKMFTLEAQRDALLEVLKMPVLATKEVSVGRYNEEALDIALSKARAAIKTVEGEKT